MSSWAERRPVDADENTICVILNDRRERRISRLPAGRLLRRFTPRNDMNVCFQNIRHVEARRDIPLQKAWRLFSGRFLSRFVPCSFGMTCIRDVDCLPPVSQHHHGPKTPGFALIPTVREENIFVAGRA